MDFLSSSFRRRTLLAQHCSANLQFGVQMCLLDAWLSTTIVYQGAQVCQNTFLTIHPRQQHHPPRHRHLLPLLSTRLRPSSDPLASREARGLPFKEFSTGQWLIPLSFPPPPGKQTTTKQYSSNGPLFTCTGPPYVPNQRPLKRTALACFPLSMLTCARTVDGILLKGTLPSRLHQV